MYKKLIFVFLLIVVICANEVGSSVTSQNLLLEKAKDALGNDISGNRQIGVPKSELSKPILVSVRDERGKGIGNVAVRFRMLNDDIADCNPKVSFTSSDGYAKCIVQTGREPGEFLLEAEVVEEPAKRLIFSYSVFSKAWVLLLFIQLIGGFSLFFFGFRVASKGLLKSAGDRLREMLFRFTKNRLLGLISGAMLTFLLQSSTAATVMLVGFLTTGLITFISVLSVLIGTAVGTTLTVQLIAFRIYNYSLLIVAFGFLLNSLKKPIRYYGQFILGFGLIFLGIKIMGQAFLPLSLSGSLEKFFLSFTEHPILIFLISTIFTAIVHSSVATIGITISLSFQGIIGLEQAFPVILGANLGTSATALLASIKGNREAKMYAAANFLFKFITVFVFFPFMGFWSRMLFSVGGSTARQIANMHTVFNVALAIIFLPLIKPIANLFQRIVPEGKEQLSKGPKFLDKGLLENPAAAIAHTNREVLRMADMAYEMFADSIDVFKTNDKDQMRDIIKKDDELDELEEAVNDYLTSISQEELTDYQSKRITSLFFISGELEHIGDIVSKSFMVYAGKKIKESFLFSREGFREIIDFHRKIGKNFSNAISAITTYDKTLAARLMGTRKWGVDKHIELHNAHIERLKKGFVETIETSTIHLDFIDDLERVNFHISNVGKAIMGKVGLEP